MFTSDFDYNLPPELIAQKPAEPRDSARLMAIDKQHHTLEHKIFSDLSDYLVKGDLVVWNNSKVFKARLFGQLVSGTGRILRDHNKPVEVLLVRPMENMGVWKVLAKPGKHLKVGTRVVFAEDFFCEPMLTEKDGSILVQFEHDEAGVRALANKYGTVPLPPYIKDEKHELESYQTIYASKDREGSVAAPTAGFHFTPELIEKMKHKGVEFAEVTLHVGLGTFLPVKSERVEDHLMHSEWVEVSRQTADKINQAKAEGRRVVAVGTTTVRTLEGVALLSHVTPYIPHPKTVIENKSIEDTGYVIHEYQGDINIFITPGFKFQIVDALITNFHLPKSTLLMLVSAFAGDREFILHCYHEAVNEKYRFYSFGDGMIIY